MKISHGNQRKVRIVSLLYVHPIYTARGYSHRFQFMPRNITYVSTCNLPGFRNSTERSSGMFTPIIIGTPTTYTNTTCERKHAYSIKKKRDYIDFPDKKCRLCPIIYWTSWKTSCPVFHLCDIQSVLATWDDFRAHGGSVDVKTLLTNLQFRLQMKIDMMACRWSSVYTKTTVNMKNVTHARFFTKSSESIDSTDFGLVHDALNFSSRICG